MNSSLILVTIAQQGCGAGMQPHITNCVITSWQWSSFSNMQYVLLFTVDSLYGKSITMTLSMSQKTVNMTFPAHSALGFSKRSTPLFVSLVSGWNWCTHDSVLIMICPRKSSLSASYQTSSPAHVKMHLLHFTCQLTQNPSSLCTKLWTEPSVVCNVTLRLFKVTYQFFSN
jgi:hypothetical protein